MDTTTLKVSITSTKAQIAAYEAASLAFATSDIQEYKLDTGQTIQWIRRPDLMALQRTLDMLYNRCSVLEVRLNGQAGIACPGW